MDLFKMSSGRFIFRSLINRPLKKVMEWHLRPRMEKRTIPPWESIQIVQSEGNPSQVGAKLHIEAKIVKYISKKATLEYCQFDADEGFEARQIEGPFDEWVYKMKLRDQGEYACEIVDQFNFKHHFSKILTFFLNKQLEKRLTRILKYKHELLQNDLDLLEKYTYERPLKILVSGSRGFVGTAVVDFLEFAGHEVWRLCRKASSTDGREITLESDHEKLEGFDTVIHLAGENVATGYWTQKKKEAILTSRYRGTENLVKVLCRLKNPPKTFICASAVGYYGDRNDEVLTEESEVGKGLFLTKVCQYWERAARDLEDVGVRVVSTRFGMVLSSKGGALKKMLLPFQLGIGGKMGHGHQYVSWIALDDLVGALYHVILTPSIRGGINFTSPNPVMNAHFAKKLAQALNRWPGPPFPGLMIRLLFGQKGEELMLASARVEPRKLLDSGYTFQFPHLKQAFEHLLRT
ncbi:TIGR01777 family oxidoreductase [Simkania negevensis]|uniref:Epimerase family protein slr1223 n=1 Tax=Simkania negevensis (strain ATCC VR-1471 / DSM 27360 / Z) TaxID=331113 RepID=F8L891_SIMNZ|nr:TIGR01777 family oxidoreductase [Simkania negevensis]CCB89013.1 epimerase family protein slr1223 [Simkania negevensis Z]